jgi:D-amino-acid dehydrogenase
MQIVVIGGGVVGLSSAYYLAGMGHDVTLLERDSPGAGASSHNAGWLVPSMATPVMAPGALGQALRWMLRRDSPFYIRSVPDPRLVVFLARMVRSANARTYAESTRLLSVLAAKTMRLYDELRDAGVRFEQHSDPLTMLFTKASHLEAHVGELEELAGLGTVTTWERHDKDQIRLLIPAVSGQVVGGLTTYDDRTVDPRSLMAGLAEACERRKVDIRTGEAARFIGTGPKALVAFGGETLSADAFVVAAGAWTNSLLSPLGERASISAGKGYGFDFPVLDGFPDRPLYLAEGKVAITPLDTGLRLSGTMGLGDYSSSATGSRAHGILRAASRYLPHFGLESAPFTMWSGVRPMTPDGVPIIGRLHSYPEVVVAAGHQMMGMTLGPPTGLAVAEMIDSKSPGAGDGFGMR